MVNEMNRISKFRIVNLGKIIPFWEELSNKALSLFIGTLLPRRIRICEVHFHVMERLQVSVTGKLFPSIHGNR